MRNEFGTIIYIMLACVFIPLIILHGIASYYGSDWVWIAQTVTLFYLLITVLGIAVFALNSWRRR